MLTKTAEKASILRIVYATVKTECQFADEPIMAGRATE